MPHNHGPSEPDNGLQRTSRYVFLGFVVVAAFYLIAEHRAHVVPILPFLLLAACPIMHIFMHRGHGHGGSRDSQPDAGHARRPSDDHGRH